MLLGMMTRFTSADITVVGLIGERGREVKEFVRIFWVKGPGPLCCDCLADRRFTSNASTCRCSDNPYR